MNLSLQGIAEDSAHAHRFEWFGSGKEFLSAQLAAIVAARQSVQLEMYIFTDSEIGRQFRDALADAAGRGVKVQLLADGFGSGGLPRQIFAAIIEAGGEQKWFNPPRLGRWALRDHRKALLVDGALAFIGGCNISDEYNGDGIGNGWRDGGISIAGPVLGHLVHEFEEQWRRADLRRWKLIRGRYRKTIGSAADVVALFIKPGFGKNPLRTALREDLKTAKDIAITSSYFLPTPRLRAQLAQAERNGARVRLILAGKSDVRLMWLASQSLYYGLVRRGIEIFEYQPQVLHAKVMVLDDIVYIGSANLDPRSLHINFEIMLRVKDAVLAAKARAQFEHDLRQSHAVTLAQVTSVRSWSLRLKSRIAYFILTKLDPWIARGHLRRVSWREPKPEN